MCFDMNRGRIGIPAQGFNIKEKDLAKMGTDKSTVVYLQCLKENQPPLLRYLRQASNHILYERSGELSHYRLYWASKQSLTWVTAKLFKRKKRREITPST